MHFDENNEIVGSKPQVRYIKLGPGNAWAQRAFAANEIPFSHREVPHDLALTLDEEKIAEHLRAQGKSPGAAMNAARQVCAFYGLDSEAIWITFADGKMWWSQAETEVIWLGQSPDYAPRIRRTRGGWAAANRFDVPFYMNSLSSRLTKVASVQSTLCKIEAEDYAIRKIYSVDEPAVTRAIKAKAAALEAIIDLIGNLHWSDFETLVDLMLARSGWHRVSAIGGNMKDVDMIVEQEITKEAAFVQVKSVSNQKELNRYIEIFDRNAEWSRMIFACHSPQGTLMNERPEIIIWAKTSLAEMVFRNGLFDWLTARAG